MNGGFNMTFHSVTNKIDNSSYYCYYSSRPKSPQTESNFGLSHNKRAFDGLAKKLYEANASIKNWAVFVCRTIGCGTGARFMVDILSSSGTGLLCDESGCWLRLRFSYCFGTGTRVSTACDECKDLRRRPYIENGIDLWLVDRNWMFGLAFELITATVDLRATILFGRWTRIRSKFLFRGIEIFDGFKKSCTIRSCARVTIVIKFY